MPLTSKKFVSLAVLMIAIITTLALTIGLLQHPAHAATGTSTVEAKTSPVQQTPQALLLLDTLHLRHLALRDMTMAIDRKASATGKPALEKLGASTWPGPVKDLGWPHFFAESLIVLGEVQKTSALGAFYHPWSDVFLVLRWAKGSDGWQVDDAEWVTGDWIRQVGDGPVDIQPLWLRGDLKRSGALALSVVQSIKAFEDIFLAQYPVDEWRSLLNLSPAGPPSLLNQNIVAARLNAVLMNQGKFNVPLPNNDPIPKIVRVTAGKTIDNLENGRMADVLKQAKKTETPHRQALSKVDAGALKDLFPVFYIPEDTTRKSRGVLFLLSQHHIDFALVLHFSTKNDSIEALELIPFAAVAEAATQIKED